jgi:hypothetical protein
MNDFFLTVGVIVCITVGLVLVIGCCSWVATTVRQIRIYRQDTSWRMKTARAERELVEARATIVNLKEKIDLLENKPSAYR